TTPPPPHRTHCRPWPRSPCRPRWPGGGRWQWPRRPDGWPGNPVRVRRTMPPGTTTGRAATNDATTCSFGWGLRIKFGMVALQPEQRGQQGCLGFRDVRIGIDAFDRADDHALGFVEMSHALGAAGRIDHVDGFTHRDGLIGTGG